MNKLMPSFIALCLILLAFSCNRKNSQLPTKAPQLGDTLSIALNTPFMIPSEDLKLTLLEVKDSRCPKNTNCIRAGEAIASIKAERPGVKQTITLEAKGNCMELSPNCGEEKLALGFRVLLLNIYPYPEDGPKPKDAPVVEAKVIIVKRD